MFEYRKSDLYRYTGTFSWKLFFLNLIFNPSFRFTFFLRYSNSNNLFIAYISRFYHYKYSIKFSLKIPYKTKIGYGLYIAHGCNVIINPTAIIGDNFTVSQFTSIGSSKGKAANIGDNVYVGPHCSIVENVNIGKNCTIGAGSVVVKDIPDDCTVAGNPAREIHFNNPGKYNLYKYKRCSNI